MRVGRWVREWEGEWEWVEVGEAKRVRGSDQWDWEWEGEWEWVGIGEAKRVRGWVRMERQSALKIK